MSKSGAFPYIQVPIAEVADDLAHLAVEAEGAYFRVVRKLAVKGPLTAREIRASVNCDTTGMEHLLNHSSTDVEPRLSFSWLEEWRIRANASRDRLSAMGKTSAEKRAAKKGKKNLRSTTVQPTLSGSSTTVEPTTILSSSISQDSEKERASKVESFTAACKAITDANPSRLAEGERKGFLAYWTEANAKGRMRFEDEDYFDHGRRMDTWMGNANRRTKGQGHKPEHTAGRRNIDTNFV